MEPIGIVVLLAAVLEFLAGGYVLIHGDRDATTRKFILFVFLTGFWVVTNYLMSYPPVDFWVRTSYAVGILLPPTALLWVLSLLKKQADKSIVIGIYAPATAFVLLIFSSSLVIDQVKSGEIGRFVGTFGVLYPLYSLYALAIISTLFVYIIQGLRFVTGERRLQLLYLVYGFLGFGVIASTVSFIFPLFGITQYIPLDSPSSLIFIVLTVYAILRYKLFDTKVVLTELLIFLLWIFIFVRTIISDSRDALIANIILLVLTIIVGYFLVRSVMQEIASRERIEKLAEELRGANAKLHKINMLKSEFVSVATHQLRSPLTAIRGYTSMLLEGGYGEVSDKIKEPLERIFRSTKTLTQVVQDFLDVSRIEQGRMQYDMSAFSFRELVEEVVEEQQQTIDASGLDFSISIEGEEDDGKYIVYGDRVKFKQVVGNIIDNAIKYTKKGFVKAKLSKKGSTMRFEVEDSGMGIDEKTLENLFRKFSRADDADKVNVSGTGLGLYIAREIMNAHEGSIWAESDGPGEGSTFIVELDTKNERKAS